MELTPENEWMMVMPRCHSLGSALIVNTLRPMLQLKRGLYLSCILLPTFVLGHGYLSSPRSRNYYANQMTKWSNPTANDPEPETEPQSLNQGTLCGAIGNKDYNAPRNALGGPMRTTIQANWTSGQEVIVEVVLTAHHKGHFVFSACPITPGTLPTQACFDKYKLTFVQDILHNANYDPQYPERAYVAPYGITRRRDMSRRDLGGSETTLYPKSVKYSYKMRLPPNMHGDLVLIQWHYLTANSCVHEGYAEYNWPDGWLDALDLDAGVRNADKCGKAGLGAEQFRNCAEVRIVSLEEVARLKAKVVEEARLKAEEEARLARIKAEEERERLKKEEDTRLAEAKEEARLQAEEDERARIKAEAEEEARLNSKEERDEDKRPPNVKGTSSPNDNEPSGKSKPKRTKTKDDEESKNDLKKKTPKKNNDYESNGKNHHGDKSKDDNKKTKENNDTKKGKKKKDNAMSKEKKKVNDDDRHKMKGRIGIKGPRRKID